MIPFTKLFRQDSRENLPHMDYEIITFHSMDHLGFDVGPQEVPPYDYRTLTVDELDEQYLGGYASPQLKNFFEYVVRQDDTLFGLELKFNITQSKLLEFNQISEAMIFPGAKIRLPIELKEIVEQSEDDEEFELRGRPARRSTSFIGVNLMDEIQSLSQSRKMNVQYLLDSGCVDGILTVNEDMLFFDPFLNEETKAKPNKNQAAINLRDLNTIKVVELPAYLNGAGELTKDFLIQLALSAIGKRGFEEKYRKKLEQMKKQGTPLASVYLRLAPNKEIQSWKDQKAKAEELAHMINDLILRKGSSDLLTSLPYFDMTKETSDDTILSKAKRILGPSCIIPSMIGESRTLEHDQFVSIIGNVPTVFRVNRQWSLLFSTQQHGSSMQTMYRQLRDINPLILVIKELKGWVFGAYLSDQLQQKSIFYGSGETFVFTFQQSTQIHPFRWSMDNQHFILCDQDGLAIGCGDKYAIYVNGEMTGGYTSQCTTFNNDVLSKEGPFEIDVLEIWGMDYD